MLWNAVLLTIVSKIFFDSSRRFVRLQTRTQENVIRNFQEFARQQLTDPPLAPDQTPTLRRETESMSLNRRSTLSIFDVAFVARQHRRRQMECSGGGGKD